MPKPEKVQWPVERSHHSTCVLTSRQGNSTQILTIGGEGNEWQQHNKQISITLCDVWIGDVDQTGKITWEEVRKRLHVMYYNHTVNLYEFRLQLLLMSSSCDSATQLQPGD